MSMAVGTVAGIASRKARPTMIDNRRRGRACLVGLTQAETAVRVYADWTVTGLARATDDGFLARAGATEVLTALEEATAGGL
jgi:hypothetical protein